MVSADVVVLGAGPAGVALASALTRRGLSVIIVDSAASSLDQVQWRNTYGAWRDDLRTLGLGHVTLTTTHNTLVRTSDTWQVLEVDYSLMHNDRLLTTLIERANARLLTYVNASVVRLRETNDQTVADLSDDSTAEGRVLFDCRGTSADTAKTFQIASGIIARLCKPYVPTGATVLMDWSGPSRLTGSFCYAIPLAHLGSDVWLIEETVLSTRDTSETLRAELLDRARRRVEHSLLEELDTENVKIALDGTGMSTGPVVGVPFGARAGYVNPISGYSVITSLQRADTVAQITADAIRLPQNIRLGAAAGAVWTDLDRRRRNIETAGAQVITDIDQRGADEFFDTFFGLPTRRWFPFLRGQQLPRQMLLTMAAMYRCAAPSLRQRLRKTRP